ncbi:glutamate--cysteine ligase [Nocardioides rotundus]|uniref:carboxylate-amine ligase n=1 Tax=Nocardioides rotundus TaxID=1774216 RepID=UPI001CBD8EDE|nr:glutamate--cysteine ligase [Nocardioides rotundus]UAL28764.1 glutamate--cysteine ligase [Nocardioides rotundus]
MVRSVGIEEELLLVHPGSGEMASVSSRVLHRHQASPSARGEGAETDLEGELLQHMVETHTDPGTDLPELGRQLRAARVTAIEAAKAAGVRAVAVGVAPLASEGTSVTPDARYERIVQEFGDTALAAGTLGMHVHVDCADRAEQIRVIDGLRPWLPLLVAVAANSPYSEGRDTGYASWRQQVWSRWPAAGQAEPFGSPEEYDRVTRRMTEIGSALDDGMLYLDARPSAEFPTVELRVADVCTDVDDAILVGSLARALVETVADPEAEVPVWRSDLLRGAHWRAARYGVGGDLVHPVSGALVPAAEALDALVATVRPALADAGDEELAARGLERLFARGSGARLQRQAWERTGDLAAVVADLVERTEASARATGTGEG